MSLPNWARVLLIMICFGVSVIGFMIKLPSAFRHVDKEMHTLFYFLAAAFLNVIFKNRNLIWHIVIFIILYLFSMAIEYAQEYSNKFFRKRIHGRYDVEDIQANLKGLVLFSMVWIVLVGIWFVYNKLKFSKTEQAG